MDQAVYRSSDDETRDWVKSIVRDFAQSSDVSGRKDLDRVH